MTTKINNLTVETIYNEFQNKINLKDLPINIKVSNNLIFRGIIQLTNFPKESIGVLIEQDNYTPEQILNLLNIIIKKQLNLIPLNEKETQIFSQFNKKLYEYVPKFFINSREFNQKLLGTHIEYCPDKIKLNLTWDSLLKIIERQEIKTLFYNNQNYINDCCILDIEQIKILLKIIKERFPSHCVSLEYKDGDYTPEQYRRYSYDYVAWYMKFISVNINTAEAIFNNIDPQSPDKYRHLFATSTKCRVEL